MLLNNYSIATRITIQLDVDQNITYNDSTKIKKASIVLDNDAFWYEIPFLSVKKLQEMKDKPRQVIL